MICRVLVLGQGDNALDESREEVRLGSVVRYTADLALASHTITLVVSHLLVVEEDNTVYVVFTCGAVFLCRLAESLDRGEAVVSLAYTMTLTKS